MSSKKDWSDYSLKRSTKSVGQLYPVLLTEEGLVIDGHHRREADPDWRTETLPHIDCEEKIILARAISNWHRRQIPGDDKREWINGLARIYLAEGYKVEAPRDEGSGRGENQIVNRIVETMAISRGSVMKYLLPKFKQEARSSGGPGPRVPASQAIEKMGRTTSHAGNLVDRHREELLNDPDFQEEVLEKVGSKIGQPSLAMDVVDSGPTAPVKESLRGRGLNQSPNMDPLVVQRLEVQNFKNLVSYYREELMTMVGGGSPFEMDKTDRALLVKRNVLQSGGRGLTPMAMKVLGEEEPLTPEELAGLTVPEEELAIEGPALEVPVGSPAQEEPIAKEVPASEDPPALEEVSDVELLADHLRVYPKCICAKCPHAKDCMGML